MANLTSESIYLCALAVAFAHGLIGETRTELRKTISDFHVNYLQHHEKAQYTGD